MPLLRLFLVPYGGVLDCNIIVPKIHLQASLLTYDMTYNVLYALFYIVRKVQLEILFYYDILTIYL